MTDDIESRKWPTAAYASITRDRGKALAEQVASAHAGDRIHVPEGDHTLDGTLELPGGVQLVGAGAVLMSIGPEPILTIKTAGVSVSGLRLVSRQTGQFLIAIEDADEVDVSECWFEGAGAVDTAIRVVNSQRIRVVECHIHNCLRAGVHFLSSRGEILENEIHGGTAGVCLQCDPRRLDIPSDAQVVGNQVYNARAWGVVFVSSVGHAEDNICSGNGSGIVVLRGHATANISGVVSVVRNQCANNLTAGIAFIESTGKVADNTCPDNDTGIFIYGVSNLTVARNHCHRNRAHGITFSSSVGHAIDNRCDENHGYGIKVARDPLSPQVASVGTVTGNQCRQNALAGIAFLSSSGHVEDNDCSGGALGITVARDPQSPNGPSDVTLLSNRCDGTVVGIVFRSSTGRAEKNMCQRCTAYGIAVDRDRISPDAPSQVTLLDNVCGHNDDAGIAFYSSIGRAESNTCQSSSKGPGIILLRSPMSQEVPSDVTLIANRCVDNAMAGIVFLSSVGRAERNECTGSLKHSGIVVERDSKIADAASRAVIVMNRCYNNHLDGIVLRSSAARLEANACWGNRSGIMIRRSDHAPDAPSHAELIGNLCCNNKHDGIAFCSSTGLAEKNESWGNREGHGIVVRRETRSPSPASRVVVRANLCHDNAGPGIAFASSDGLAENNECWGSRGSDGIRVGTETDLSDSACDVSLIANRCHGNLGFGITAVASSGRIEANECWLNGQGSLAGHGILLSQATKNFSRPITHPFAKRMGPWLSTRPIVSPQDVALVDFLCSGGCPRCFERFWTTASSLSRFAEAGAQQSSAHGADSEAAAESSAVTYQVISRETAVEICRYDPVDQPDLQATRSTRTGVSELSSLLIRFQALHAAVNCRRFSWMPSREQSPRWTVALVTADDQELETWLEVASSTQDGIATTEPAPFRVVTFDLSRFGASDTKKPASFVEEHVRSGASFWRRWWLRASALALIPVSQALLSVLALVCAFVASLSIIADELGVTLEPGSLSHRALVPTLHAFAAAVTKSWSSHIVFFTTHVAGWVLIALLIVNRLLPASLTFATSELVKLIEALGRSGPQWLSEKLSACTRAGSPLRTLARSEAARRLWLRHQVYGFRLFGAWRGRSLQPCVIVLRNVDVPTDDEQREIRQLLEVCPMNQSVLLVTQMPGLSMLVGAYLDVWFDSGKPRPEIQGTPAFLVHDQASVRIDATTTNKTTTDATERRDHAKDLERQAAVKQLGHILGWPDAATHALSPGTIDADGFANELLRPTFDVSEMLPVLVMGSTPHMYMKIAHEHLRTLKWLSPAVAQCFEVFDDADHSRAFSDKDQPAELNACAERAMGLLFYRAQRLVNTWIGRAGYRKRLSTALRELFSAAATAHGGDAERYLFRLLACAERYHVGAAISLLKASPEVSTPTHGTAREAQLAVLHMRAALFVASERFSLHNVPSFDLPLVLADWDALHDALQRTRARVPARQAVEACAIVMQIVARYRKAGVVVDWLRLHEQELDRVIDNLLKPVWNEMIGAWGVAFRRIQSVMLKLVRLEHPTARRLLAAQLVQEWRDFPVPIKEALQRRLTTFDAWWASRLSNASTADELFSTASQLCGHPSLMIFALGGLAAENARRLDLAGSADATRALEQAADALLRLRDSAGAGPDVSGFQSFHPSHELASLPEATALLRDEGRLSQLVTLIVSGRACRDRLAEESLHADAILEGVALGIHGKLNRIVDSVDQLPEVTLVRTG